MLRLVNVATRWPKVALRQRAARTSSLLAVPSKPTAIARHFAAGSSTQNDNKNCRGFPLWYSIAGGLLFAVGGGVKWWMDHVGGTEGLRRSVYFYSYAIPKYILYRYHVWNKSPDEVWEELDRDTSKGALRKIEELRGFYIKTGQVAAANIGDAFPEVWQDTMSVLQDQCPREPFETIKAIVASDLDFDNIFATFEEEPIGSASIGQVHRATLKDGTQVVVKVKYPSAETLLRGDVRTIRAFCELAQPVHVPALRQVEKQFMEEFDYRDEARHLATVRKNLIDAGLAGDNSADNKLCLVPKPYPELCTENVLVMTELKGEKLATALKHEAKALANDMGETAEQFAKRVREEEKAAKARGTELKGPSSAQYDMLISLLDGKRRTRNAARMLFNNTAGLIPGVKRKEYEDKSALPINHSRMIDDLIHVHGHEILVDGYFNGDPHPGNVLLVRSADGSPQLGLIDYGSTGKLSKEQRHLLCRLIIALADDDKENVVRLMIEAGWKSKRMDSDIIFSFAKVSYDQDNYELTNGLHIQLFIEELQARDPIISSPEQFILVYGASVRLRGLAHALHQPRSLAKAWKPIAERVLQEDS